MEIDGVVSESEKVLYGVSQGTVLKLYWKTVGKITSFFEETAILIQGEIKELAENDFQIIKS